MPTFRGRHDWIKAQSLFGLLKHQEDGNTRLLSISEWSEFSNVRYSYLNARISQFFQWGYINRDSKVYKGRSVFGYKLGCQGQEWLERHVLSVPERVAELERRLPKNVKTLFASGR